MCRNIWVAFSRYGLLQGRTLCGLTYWVRVASDIVHRPRDYLTIFPHAGSTLGLVNALGNLGLTIERRLCSYYFLPVHTPDIFAVITPCDRILEPLASDLWPKCYHDHVTIIHWSIMTQYRNDNDSFSPKLIMFPAPYVFAFMPHLLYNMIALTPTRRRQSALFMRGVGKSIDRLFFHNQFRFLKN